MYNRFLNFFADTVYKLVFYLLIVAFSLFFYFGSIFFGLDFTDAFFHINSATNNEVFEYNFMTVLSSVLLKYLIILFSKKLIILRVINALVLITPIFVYQYFFRIPLNFFLLWLSLILFTITPLNYNILGYDSFSVFINSMLLLVILKANNGFNYKIIFLLSILSCCSILIRFPNIMVIFITSIVLLVSNNNIVSFKSSNVFKPFVYVVLTFTSVILGFLFFYKNYETFMHFKELPSQGYSIKDLSKNYIRDAKKIILFGIEIGFILFLLTKINFNKKFSLFFFVVLALFHFLFIYKFVSINAYSWLYSLYITAIVIVFFLVSIFFEKLELSKNNFFFLIYILFLFVIPSGSNTGFLKAVYLIILFPFFYELATFKGKNFFLFFFISIIPFAILEKFSTTYEDSKILELNSTPREILIENVKTTAFRVDYINCIGTEYKLLHKKGYAVFFYGNKSHVFNYLYPKNQLDIKEFYQPIDNLTFLDEILKKAIVQNHVAIFIVNEYPKINNNSRFSILEQELIKNAFIPVIRKEYVYFIRSGKS